ncbi:hypothetical protein AVEN_169402-1 [Araneus ventricosus]|uniref:Integrase catalytic domain-containing protein n=1 Tax=Araneus ventricosus TaxID=182803 RepID=A0A4Y2JA71_ARAVE|nr:hypothetical protein AVEN_169402-1 [Araneus ventricosus]
MSGSQRCKVIRHTNSPIQYFHLLLTRFVHVHLDLVAPLMPSDNCEYLLTCIDSFTRWPKAISISDISTETVERIHLTVDFTLWLTFDRMKRMDQGRTQRIRDDNLKETFFLSKQTFGHTEDQDNPYQLSSNGIVECFHRSLKEILIRHASTKWIESIPVVLFGLRILGIKGASTVHISRTSFWFYPETTNIIFCNPSLNVEPHQLLKKFTNRDRPT